MTISKFPPENPAVVMSDTQPSTKVDGTIWVDTNSDVPVVNPTDYVLNSLVQDAGQIIASSAANTPAVVPVGTATGQVLTWNAAGSGVGKITWAAAPAAGLEPFFLAGV